MFFSIPSFFFLHKSMLCPNVKWYLKVTQRGQTSAKANILQ